MRVVSLVPNATEIVFALGAGELLVAVSHECDYPPAARELPTLTGGALAAGLDAAAVDRAVSAQLADGASLYTLDAEHLRELAPDLILTQELCPVCAVSTAQVDGALAPLPACPVAPGQGANAPVGVEILSLDPRTLADVMADIGRIGQRLGRARAAVAVVAGLQARLAAVRRWATAAAAAGWVPPRVLALEWLDPPFVGGHWVPEMIAAAGGLDVLGVVGGKSRRLDWGEVAAADPDVIVAMPCGFDAVGARAQLATLAGRPEWTRLRAVANGRVYAVDANGLFSRPGPRLVDGVERLVEIFGESGA